MRSSEARGIPQEVVEDAEGKGGNQESAERSDVRVKTAAERFAEANEEFVKIFREAKSDASFAALHAEFAEERAERVRDREMRREASDRMKESAVAVVMEASVLYARVANKAGRILGDALKALMTLTVAAGIGVEGMRYAAEHDPEYARVKHEMEQDLAMIENDAQAIINAPLPEDPLIVEEARPVIADAVELTAQTTRNALQKGYVPALWDALKGNVDPSSPDANEQQTKNVFSEK